MFPLRLRCSAGLCSRVVHCRQPGVVGGHSVSRLRRNTRCQAAPPSGSGDGDTRSSLLQTLAAAVESQDFKAAVEIKRKIDAVDDADPLLNLKKRLQQAVADERFKDAAQLKQQLLDLEARLQPEQIPCCSDTTTHGVRVQVQSQYIPERSLPTMSQYFFTYRVTLTNNSSRTVQLKSRHWVITDGNGRVEHVRGTGVVGEEPVLAPSSQYSYQSVCPLHTSQGSMAGEFMMSVLEGDSSQGELLEVEIGKFGLRLRK